ncbi:major capsid protein P2 [Methylibium sp.]|uniref:major capsid protein P2 n=1 Tax=Methylibium sp. TaxID=2067992 RepID=UPI0017F0FB34|nr:major capsid protein P2 [Methylibium sp.]MBA3590475.1 hypothetical protein [Methylibium sp.]
MLIATPRRLTFPIQSGRDPDNNGTTIISLPVGRNGHAYKQVDLLLTLAGAVVTDANIDTHLARVVVRLNGRTFIDVTGLEWMDLTGFDRALTANSGIVPIRFGQLDARTIEGEDDPVFGTLDVDALEIELQWSATAGAIVDKVECQGTVLANEPLGQYHSWRRYSPTFSGASEHIWDGIKLSDRQALAALHVKNANVSNVKVELGNVMIMDSPKKFLDHELREYEKIPNAIWCHVDLTRMHRHSHALPLGGDLRNALTFSVDPAGAVVIIAKTVEQYAR